MSFTSDLTPILTPGNQSSSSAQKIALPLTFAADLEKLIHPFNGLAHDRKHRAKRSCAIQTRQNRKSDLLTIFGELLSLGFALKSATHIREKHVKALVGHWLTRRLSPHSIHRKLSVLRLFCGWIGKRGLVRDIEHYVADPSSVRRQHIANSDKSWEGHGIDVLALVEQAKMVDERLACILLLEHRFGLRAKEAMCFQPHASGLEEIGVLEVVRGGKGGRPRCVAIRTDEQREALAWAKSLVTKIDGSLMWPGLSWPQARRRYYHLMERIGATKNGLGVTGHGLRAGFAQRELTRKTGVISPANGGVLEEIRDVQAFDLGRLQVSWSLGHGRVDVTNSYYGSFGHQLRTLRQSSQSTFKQEPTPARWAFRLPT